MEAPIVDSEIKETLSGFQKSKSLGPDGLNLDFFEAFFELIREDLVSALNEWRMKG